jgi:hypothetical protein
MARTLVLLGSLLVIGLLGTLTVAVVVEHGVDPLTIASLALLALLALGVIGALTTKPPDD